MISLVRNTFCIQRNENKYLKYYKVETHFQAARESPDLKMDIRSFDHVLKQLHVYE